MNWWLGHTKRQRRPTTQKRVRKERSLFSLACQSPRSLSCCSRFLSLNNMAEKYPSLLPETYAKVMEISSKLSKNCKSVNDIILLKAVKPRTEILKVNGMDKKPAKVQADILYESTKALNELVVQTRCREVHKIKESIKKKFKGEQGREGKHWDVRLFCSDSNPSDSVLQRYL